MIELTDIFNYDSILNISDADLKIEFSNKIKPILFYYDRSDGYNIVESKFIKYFRDIYYFHTENLFNNNIYELTFSEIKEENKQAFLTVFFDEHISKELIEFKNSFNY